MGIARLASSHSDYTTAARLQVDFNNEYGWPAPDPDELSTHLARLGDAGDTRVWLVEHADAGVVGHGIVRYRPQSLVDELEGYLAELYVKPEHRYQRLGTVLLQAILDDARALGATYFDLNTSESDDDRAARALYERFGFDCHEGRGSGPRAIYYELDL